MFVLSFHRCLLLWKLSLGSLEAELEVEIAVQGVY